MNEMIEARVGSEKTIASREDRIMTNERIYLAKVLEKTKSRDAAD